MTDAIDPLAKFKPVQPQSVDPLAKFKLPTAPVVNEVGIAPKPYAQVPLDTPVAKGRASPFLQTEERQALWERENPGAARNLTVADVISDPERLGKIRNMMVKTKDGQKWATAPAEEVMDSFMNHMRWFNANEASTAVELMHVTFGSDEEKKARAEAYKVYDEMGFFLENNPTLSGIGDALLDYTKATVSSPSFIGGVLVGKMWGSVASRAGAKAAKEVAEAATKGVITAPATAMATAKGKVAATRAWPRGTTVKTTLDEKGKFVKRSVTSTKTAKEAAKPASTAAVAAKVDEIVNATTTMVVKKSAESKSGNVVKSNLVREEIRNFVTQGAAKQQVAGTLGFEVGMATLQDYMYQQVMLETEYQDEYSLMQTALSSLAGGISGLPSVVGMQAGKQTTLGNARELIEKSYEARAKVAREKAGPRIKSSFTQFATDWKTMADAGQGVIDNSALGDKLYKWFFDFNDENSLVRILLESGSEISRDTDRISQDVINAAYGMGDEALREINEAFKTLGLTFGEATLIARNVIPARSVNAAGKELEDAAAMIAAKARKDAEGMNLLSQTSRFMNAIQRTATAKRNAAEIIAEAASKEVEDAPLSEADFGRYYLSFLKKTITANPVTTTTNVKGWGLAQSSTALANLVTAGGLMGRAGIRAVFDPTGAWKDVGKAYKYVANQTFSAATMFDPLMTAEAFFTMLENAPTATKKTIAGQIFAGVDQFGPEKFNITPKTTIGRKWIQFLEWYASKAQATSFVHVQDTLTKSITGIQELDLQVRLKFDKSLNQLIADGEFYKVDVDMWDKVGQATLRATFSEDLSKGNSYFSDMAQQIQKLSNNPIFGPLSGILFGNFLNSVIAFTYRHSPLALFPALGKVFKPGADETASQALSRAVVGTVAWSYFLPKNEAEKQAEGLAWYEERNEDGSVSNIGTLFPKSLFNLVGRINHNLYNGQGMDIGLMDELNKQLVIMDALENAGAPGWLQEGARFLANPQVPFTDKKDFAGIIYEVGQIALNTATFVASEAAILAIGGPTRPFATINQAVSLTYPEAGGGVLADAKQAEGLEKVVLNGSRNVSSFFNFFFGEETEYGVRLLGKPRETALREGPVKMSNPVAQVQGETLQPVPNAINKMLAMVDKQPFRAESFTTGVPEWDAFMNKTVTPLLEQEAQALLKSELFLKAPHSAKMDMVEKVLTRTRDSVIDLVEGGYIGDANTRLLNERRKFATMPIRSRNRARKETGIVTPDRKLSLVEIEKLRLYIEMDKLKFRLGK